ncbi:PREDICTED: uncharacterized protein At2g27730, mitochondrial [Tarenaya hassleriana]|uniref:uncharacterized protein At2g27730, mitochondrial n=1 Tax=Tarenaya hassleriana TaxID=28532 RepID=UPI00053C11C8|nr:PREDICTED: uncharacterized protein At2g27730, mitochondrial [Tarenaya hassleriana]XP_010521671.1 PREDICTED: uncharacterized protein At2g27730, mitochondrial [Tarenaya hassleriana]
MATRSALRFVSRRFSSGGKVLGEEEKAAENVYIKKMEQEKLEKIARKGPKPGEQPAAEAGGSGTQAKTSEAASSSGESAPKVSEDKYRNYAVVAGAVTIIGAVGWYMKSGGKKQPEAQD